MATSYDEDDEDEFAVPEESPSSLEVEDPADYPQENLNEDPDQP